MESNKCGSIEEISHPNLFTCKVPSFGMLKYIRQDVSDNVTLILDQWSLVKFYNLLGKYMNCSDVITRDGEIYLLLMVDGIEFKIMEGDLFK